MEGSVHATVAVAAFLVQDLHPDNVKPDAADKLRPGYRSGDGTLLSDCLKLPWSPTVVRLGPCQLALVQETAQEATMMRRRMLGLFAGQLDGQHQQHPDPTYVHDPQAMFENVTLTGLLLINLMLNLGF